MIISITLGFSQAALILIIANKAWYEAYLPEILPFRSQLTLQPVSITQSPESTDILDSVHNCSFSFTTKGIFFLFGNF